MSKRHSISVIIPAYNRAGLIGETLQSLLNQTVPATEIIVVDDGSTDDTARVVERIAEELEVIRSEIGKERGTGSREQGGETALRSIVDSELLIADCAGGAKALDAGPSTLDSPPAMKPQLRLIRQANAGPGAARNRGLAEATGEFIHFFDSDDIAAPNKHEVQLQALLETGADIAYGAWCKGRFVNLTTEDTENTEEKTVLRLASQAGAAFSNPSTSELARHSENLSPARSASGPALARIAPEDRRLKIEAGEANSPATSYSLPVTAPKALALDSGRSTLDSGPWNFVPEGPVLQARGLPKGDLVRALLTNWSIVPHACLFRRSILKKVGGFPEDIWVGEDQLFFLRCLLAGARVVHTPGTMVFYRVGDDPGKLTATGVAQKRHARDWARFLLKAKKEIEDGRSKMEGVPAEARRRGDFFGDGGSRGLWGAEVVSHGGTANTEEPQGDAQGTCARAAFSNPSTSELARTSENTSPTRFARGPASLPATSYSLPATCRPSAWFGFRLRAYEAWRDLENFFPDGEGELKNEMLKTWQTNFFSSYMFFGLGFFQRKIRGFKKLIFGHRAKADFRARKISAMDLEKFPELKF